MEEASHANLLLHVLDASDPAIGEYYETTVKVLSELGAGEIPVITVLNKIDKLDDWNPSDTAATGALALYPGSVAVSAKNGLGLDALKRRVASKLQGSDITE